MRPRAGWATGMYRYSSMLGHTGFNPVTIGLKGMKQVSEPLFCKGSDKRICSIFASFLTAQALGQVYMEM